MKVLRVGYVEYEKYTNPCLAHENWTETCLRPGISIEIWRLLAESLNFTLDLYRYERFTGERNSTLAALRDGEVDAAGS